jgi:hypothetical protein
MQKKKKAKERNLEQKKKIIISRKMRSEIANYDVQKLKDIRNVREFQENIWEMAREVKSNPETVDEQRKIIKHTLEKVSEKVLGKAQRTNKPWLG